MQNTAQTAFTTKFPNRVRVLRTPVKISKGFSPDSQLEQPDILDFQAVWDTGATDSVISSDVVSKLALNPVDKKDVNTANGTYKANVHLVNIFLPNSVVFQECLVTESTLVGCSVLIGMDIISCGDLAITHPNDSTQLSFCFPADRNIDFVKEVNKTRVMRGVNKKRKNRRL